MKNITWVEILLFVHTRVALTCMMWVLCKQRNVGTAFAWPIILLLFPVFGTIGYPLVGEPWLGSACTKRMDGMNRFYSGFVEKHLKEMYSDVGDKVKPHYHDISRVVACSTGLGATQGNGMTLLATINDIIDTMLADIGVIEHSRLLTSYIIESQGRIGESLDAVLRTAGCGVDCAILADAVSSSGFLGSVQAEELRDVGVEVHFALPVRPLRTLFTRSDLYNH